MCIRDSGFSEKTYKSLIEDLISSPKFGERWARHWLDVARFGESHGFEQDYDRKFAFHYRDFVIRSFNSDMPYDEFTRWQIAGDELAPDDPNGNDGDWLFRCRSISNSNYNQ